ncbi:uncharacterized protein LOC130724192 [Lotus japonicus]|uniref:uncharacterized protein LOC130724192 n=1 Tax=Lotus japonicus TaxID=34305 RepID=UPI00258882D4|nr:uncharacterized protein LOC130724192 [Lotus japonicus]
MFSPPPHFIRSCLPTVMGSTFESHDSINENQNELLITHTVGECNNLSVNLNCPICMDVWVNRGEHHICCLPCGHIYGMSCIKRWLQRNHGSGKCPQCNETCSLVDVRRLYASVVVADDEKVNSTNLFIQRSQETFKKI